MYELALKEGTKLSQVVNRADDLAIALKAESVRIVAPEEDRDGLLGDLGAGLVEQTVQATAIVLLVICTANTFGFYMTWEKIPVEVAEAMLALTENPYFLLLLINLILIGVGMFVEGSAALILLTPILVPVITSVGIDPVHFGIVMVLNLTIAGVTPPLGTLMFTVCAVTGVSISHFVRAAWPFYLLLFAMLLILTFVPVLSLWLPDLQMN